MDSAAAAAADCSDGCLPVPAPSAVVSGVPPSLGASTSLPSQLYLDQFACGGLPTPQHCLSVSSQCPPPVEPPHFGLHLSSGPPPPPQVQPLLGGQSPYPQNSGGSAPGLGMLYNPAVSSLVKREPRTGRDTLGGPGVMGGWHTMSPPVGYRDRRIVPAMTPTRNSSTPAAAAVSNQLQHQHELSTRSITNNNHETTSDRKKSRRSGNSSYLHICANIFCINVKCHQIISTFLVTTSCYSTGS